ncbi:DUF2637 domain-containing protein [Kitasatospora sp. NPDC092948]|uniref:DUF2637 domain-containing protein n=1 Tax=Kitasatospora sp. NPDC092948 TaxID=3364088 RepID=UPI003819C6FF
MNPPSNHLAISVPGTSWLPGWAWFGHHADKLLAGLVLAIAALLMLRAWRRSEAAYKLEQTLTPEELNRRDALADRRGRQGDDLGVIIVALAAAKLSSDGLRKLGRDIGLQGYWDWLPFLALDVAAYVCGRRARRRSRNNEPPGLSGVLVWVLAATSSAFSASEATTLKGQIARAIWPIIAAVLFELGSIEERGAARRRLREAGEWLDRRLRLLRLAHPLELVHVALALAADADLSQADATRIVRVQGAAQRLYVLRLLDSRLPSESRAEPRSRRKDKAKRAVSPRGIGTFLLRLRLGLAERRAQAAQTRVRAEDHDDVLAALRRLVRTREFAALNFDDSQAVESLRATTLGDRPAPAALATAGGGYDPLPYPGEGATTAGAGTAGVLASAGTPRPAVPSYPLQPRVHPAGAPGAAGTPIPPHPAEPRVHPIQDRVYPGGPQVHPADSQVYPTGVPAPAGTPGLPCPPAEQVHPAAGQVHPKPPTREAPRSIAPVEHQVTAGMSVDGPGSPAADGGEAGRDRPRTEDASDLGAAAPHDAPSATGRAREVPHAGDGESGRADDQDDEESGKRLTPKEIADELLAYVNEATGCLTIGIGPVKSMFRCGQTKAKQAMALALVLHREQVRATRASTGPQEAEHRADADPATPSVPAVPAQGVLRELVDAGV